MKVWAFAGPMSPGEAADFRKKWKSPTMPKLNHSVRENHKILDGERGFERFGRELADCHSTSWQEYWPFLDAFADLRSEEGLDKLNLFFHKQEVIHFVQALLRGENFVPAEQYTVNNEFILDQDLSELEESEDENDGYFSADSHSFSEDDSSDVSSSIAGERSAGSSSINTSRGMFFSLWGGVVKLIKKLTPSFGRHEQNGNSLSCAPVTNAEEQSQQSSVTSLESPTSPCNNHTDSESCESNQTDVTASFTMPDDTTQTQQAVTLSCTNGDTQLDVQINDLGNSSFQCQEHVHRVTDSLSGEQCVVSEEADMDLSRTPEKWKYRTLGKSLISDSPSPEKAFSDNLSPSSDQDEVSPAYPQPRNGHRLNVDSLDSPQDRALSSKQNSCEAHLDDSFNTKMDTFSTTLQKFTILSPTASPAMSATNTSSAPSSILTEEPCVHIFTGKMFSKFVSELKSRKYTSAAKEIPEDPSELPTVFIRQADDNSVLADVFLPMPQRAEDSWLKPRGRILDELTHKEVIKNVWVNFLVVFPTSDGANRILSLSEDAVVCAVVEGVQDDKDTYTFSSTGKVDSQSLTYLFLTSKDSLVDSKNTFTLFVRIVRSATLPVRDVFICGLPSPSRVLRSERREPPPLSPLVSTPVRPIRQPEMVDSSSAGQAHSDSVVRNLFNS
ncbi:unnamed protein product [Candidula unifasciata]|uniref:ANKLE2 third alpha/beta domain-containing protein n=1 Tax=Candidula unifasciata TaxID=100452 RepID=A0A8S3ZSQ1_9EUPU|nr:unnamed protein product [Candidula unifasciata]